MDNTIDSLQIDIVQSATTADKSIDALVSSLEKLDGISKSNSFNILHSRLKKISELTFGNVCEELNSITKSIEKISAYKKSFNNINLGTPTINTEKINNNIDGIVEEVQKAKEPIIELEEKFNENATKSTIEPVKEQFQELSGAINNNVSAVDNLGRGLNGIKRPAMSATTSLQKLWSSIKRIALYRTIRKVLQLITNAFKEGINNIYQYDKTVNGIFSQSMDRLATSSQYWKNSLGAALAPLIVMITPMIENLAEALANVNNTIGQVFSALAGQSTYLKANSSAIKKYAETAKKAVVSFDEINTLSNANTNFGEMFTTEEISEGLQFLQIIGIWLRENKELVEKVLVAFATLATVNWVSEKAYLADYISQLSRARIGTNDLTTAFNNKNTALNQQSQATATDLAAVIALASGFSLAASKVGDLSDVISGWDSSKIENSFENITDVIGELNSEIEDLQLQLDSLPNKIETVKTGVSTLPAIGDTGGIVSTLPATGSSGSKISTLPAIVSGGSSSLPVITNPVIEEPVIEAPNIEVEEATVGDVAKAGIKIWWNNSKIGKAINAIGNGISSIGKGIKNGLGGGVSIGDDIGIGVGTGIGAGLISLLPTLAFFADGSYDIPAGQMFIARESGAEMVGTIGRRTTVANNEQIVEGIKQGVFEAMIESGNNQGGDWTIQIIDSDNNVKSEKIISAAERRNRRDGKTIIAIGG